MARGDGGKVASLIMNVVCKYIGLSIKVSAREELGFVLDLRERKRERTLVMYGKMCGFEEWITYVCVCF